MAPDLAHDLSRMARSQAFALLVRASQATNRKLHDVADELVSTGSLPRG